VIYATGLRCYRCGTTFALDPHANVCPNCGPGGGSVDPGILDVQYDYGAASTALLAGGGVAGERTDVFRWLPLLPVEAPGPVLPAGGTPLVSAPRLAARLGLAELLLKDETRNPTRCLKDRATALGVTMALQAGRRELYCASAGNAAISLAGFCANLGLTCHVYVPREVSETRLGWLRRYGADVHISRGNYDQAFDESEADGRANGWFSRNCAFNPYLVEGKKTVALEIGESLRWQVPDFVVAPVGDGCTLGAIGKGFRELQLLGLADALPRLVGVQSERIQPLVQRRRGELPHDNDGSTEAASIAVRTPRNALRLLDELERSDGSMEAVSDEEIAEAQRLLAKEAGLVAEFTSSATLAALLKLREHESFGGRTAVLVITGGRADN
jgi:threonine synthase